MAAITMRRAQGILALAVLASSCGGGAAGPGGDAGSTCAAVAPCGGGVIGTWKITDSCVAASLDLSSACAGITATLAASFSGQSTYNADLTYTQTGTTGGTAHYHFPRSCIGTQTCAQVQADLLTAGSTAGMGMTFGSASCSSDGTGCACDAVLASSSANEAGTYTTSGGTLTTVHSGTTDSSPYCVSGSTMHQMPPTSAGATGAIVFTNS